MKQDNDDGKFAAWVYVILIFAPVALILVLLAQKMINAEGGFLSLLFMGVIIGLVVAIKKTEL